MFPSSGMPKRYVDIIQKAPLFEYREIPEFL